MSPCFICSVGRGCSCAATTRFSAVACRRAGQPRPFLQLNFPRIPQPLLELVVGFFDIIARRHQAEAAALVLWSQETRAVELLVPPQVAVVGGHRRTRPIRCRCTTRSRSCRRTGC